jgi:hypothetical protein
MYDEVVACPVHLDVTMFAYIKAIWKTCTAYRRLVKFLLSKAGVSEAAWWAESLSLTSPIDI